MENNWTINQTKELFALVNNAVENGKGLKSAFSEMADKSGRSLNSVRNYYYSQLKMFDLVPSLAADLGITVIKSAREQFELFTEDQINSLMRKILIGKANGISVRGTINSISADSKEALRLQNKYRSMVAHHKNKVTAIMNELSKENIKHYNPYTKQINDGTVKSGLTKLNEYISKLDESEVGSFLALLSKLV
ncbi:MAG: hypothetical protein E7350_00760 [Clostridiales bacterium]|nr:hypothetical protein [Clostridiales bacterium]